jgi:hypothetical protein
VPPATPGAQSEGPKLYLVSAPGRELPTTPIAELCVDTSARLLRALRIFGNPTTAAQAFGEVVFLCIASARVNFRFCREAGFSSEAAVRGC